MRRVDLTELGLTAPRFRPRDMIREALLSIGAHPARALLTAIGTVLGAAAFVATLGLSSTLTQQVSSTFDAQRATEVTVAPEHESGATQSPASAERPWQQEAALARLRALSGVETAARRTVLTGLTAHRTPDPSAGDVETDVIGMDSAGFAAVRPRISAGRTFDAFHDRTSAPVVLLPPRVARELGVHRVGVAVFIGGRAYTVAGFFDDVASRPETMLSIVMPFGAAQPLARTGQGEPAHDVIVTTAPGAAQAIGSQAAMALSPGNPSAVRAVAPPDPQSLRRDVQGPIRQLSLILSLVALGIGAVSIGNAATAGINARVPEIGLRRAVGARPRHVFTQLLTETTLLGALGGVLGALIGVLITVGAALFQSWQPVIDITVALTAASGGAIAGLLAGLVPATRAMRIPPVAALQR